MSVIAHKILEFGASLYSAGVRGDIALKLDADDYVKLMTEMSVQKWSPPAHSPGMDGIRLYSAMHVDVSCDNGQSAYLVGLLHEALPYLKKEPDADKLARQVEYLVADRIARRLKG